MSILKIADLHISDSDERVSHFNLLTDDEQTSISGGQTIKGGRIALFSMKGGKPMPAWMIWDVLFA